MAELFAGGAVVSVVRSARRKRTIAIRVADGVVTVRAPVRTPSPEIEDLLRQRSAWINDRLARDAARPGPRRFAGGERLPYLGSEIVVCRCAPERKRATVDLDGDVLHVSSGEGRVRDAVVCWYRSRAAVVFGEAVARWSAACGLAPRSVLVRDQKHRWGSCGPDGTIRLNWRLVMAEQRVIEYVVVHELAHLRHKNHGPEFWAEVAGLVPDHRVWRRRLRAVGSGLVV